MALGDFSFLAPVISSLTYLLTYFSVGGLL